MPINIPLPQLADRGLYALLAEVLRRAVDGSIALPDGKGIILASPDGTKYRLGVSNEGAITATPL